MLAQLQFHSLDLLPVSVALVAAVTAWTLWVYRAQLQDLRPGWRWVLPALRTAAVVALGLAMLKPVIVRPRTVAESGPVVLLLDRSMSMGVTDQRIPAERVDLAEGLGLLPASRAGWRELENRTVALRARVESLARIRSELEYARLADRSTEQVEQRLQQAYDELRREVERATMMARGEPDSAGLDEEFDRLFQALSQATAHEVSLPQVLERIERLQSSLGRLRMALAQRLYDSDPLVRNVSDELIGLDRITLVWKALFEQGLRSPPLIERIASGSPLIMASFAEASPQPLPGTAGSALPPAPDGAVSDIVGVIERTAREYSVQNPQAIVLISDGRQTTAPAAAALPAFLPPVFAVDPTVPVRRDRAVVHVTMPRQAYVDETITIRVEVVDRNVSQGKLPVILELAGSRRVIEADIRDERGRVEFRVRLEKPGTHLVRVGVEERSDEITTRNNVVIRPLRVLAQKVKVALIGGSGTWEYQFVRSAMERAPWIESQDVIIHSSDSPTIQPASLLGRDVLLLFDVDPQALQARQWDAVFQFVSERGGSVILSFTQPEWPARYVAHPLLSSLLPWPGDVVPSWRTWPGEEAYLRVVPAGGSEELEALRLADDAERNRLRWAELPAMYRVLPLGQLRPGVRPLLVERESQQPVMTEMRLGAGKVIFVGVPETWRWRYRIGERDHDRFWLQLVRHAAEPPYAASAGGLSLDVDRVDPRPDQSLGLRARVLDDQGLPRPDVRPMVRILRQDQIIRSEPLGALETMPGRFSAVVPGLQAGHYRLELVLEGHPTDESAEPGIDLHVEPDVHGELVDVSGDAAFLRQLTDATGGQLLGLDRIDTLPDKITEIRRRRPATVEYALWSSPWVYLFVVGCLGAEWGLRKRLGLA